MAGPELLHREVLSSPRWRTGVLTAIVATTAFAAGRLTAECGRASIQDRASAAQRQARASARAAEREVDAVLREVDAAKREAEAAQRALAAMQRALARQQRAGEALPVVPLRIEDAPLPPDPVCGGAADSGPRLPSWRGARAPGPSGRNPWPRAASAPAAVGDACTGNPRGSGKV